MILSLVKELLAGADLRVRIDMFGTMESLNVAVATGILLHAMATYSEIGRLKKT